MSALDVLAINLRERLALMTDDGLAPVVTMIGPGGRITEEADQVVAVVIEYGGLFYTAETSDFPGRPQ